MSESWAGGMHWSYRSMAWCGLFKTLRDGRALCRHEFTWTHTTPEAAAEELAAFLAARKIDLGSISLHPKFFPLDKKARGETVSETFQNYGISVVRADPDRPNGWSRVRSWLAVRKQRDGIVSPSLLIHADCAYLLRTMPTLISKTDDPDDIHETPEEFPASGVRYYVMSRPMPSIDDEPELPPYAVGHLVRELREAARG